MITINAKLLIYSAGFLVLALLFNFSTDKEMTLAEKQVLLSKGAKESFDIIGDLEKFSEWYPGVSGYIEIESGPKTRGKRYRETITLPLIGNINYVHTLRTFDPNSLTIEFIDDSWLRMRYKLWFHAQNSFHGEPRTMMYLQLSSGFKAYWFQYIASPFVRFLYDQRLRSAAFNARYLIDGY